jgi:hypothetical protein
MATYKQATKVATPVVGADNIKQTLLDVNMSIANMHSNVYPGTKTSGITVRGGKAQTKGKLARGPMA